MDKWDVRFMKMASDLRMDELQCRGPKHWRSDCEGQAYYDHWL